MLPALVAALLLSPVAAAPAARPTPASAAPRVAVIYSAWGHDAFKTEFDGHLQSLGWPHEAFENTKVGSLIGRLSDFDIVISAGVGNYDNPQDMTRYRDAWLGFVRRGGLLLITDASYDSVLGQWVGGFGPGWALTSSTCALMKDKARTAECRCDAASPLLHVPNDLPPLLAQKQNIWAHLATWGSGWRSLVTCPDGKSLMVTRDVGKGTIVVTSFYSFRSTTDRALVTALLENLWTHVQGLRSGVAVTALDLGRPVLTPQRATLRFRNISGTAADYEATVSVAAPGGAAPVEAGRASASVAPGGEAKVDIPFALTRRGPAKVSIVLAAAGKPAFSTSETLDVPPMVALALRDRHLYPYDPTLHFRADFAPDPGLALASLTAELLVDGKSVWRASPPAAGSYSVALGGLAPGTHRVRLRLAEGYRTLGAADASFAYHPMPAVYIDPAGVAMVGGKPFFPFGWYHVSWGFTAADRLACLRDIAAAGFNTVHAGIKQIDEWGPLLDEAAKRGVHVVTEFGVDPQKVIARYRDKPAVLAWNPGDEMDGAGIAPKVAAERADALKTADPNHPTYMTLCVPATYHLYAGCADIIAPDPYPIGSAPTSMVYTDLHSAWLAARKHGRTVWGVLQCFGYPQKGGRVPSFAEVRNMTYLALLAAVKGIIYYTYADGGFKVTDHPKLWAGMKTLPAEIRAVEPWILGGDPVRLEAGADDVYAGYWRAATGGTGGKAAPAGALVCVVNTSEKTARQVSLPLPAGVGGAAHDVFAGSSSGLAVEKGRLVGRLGPLQVAVCRVDG